MIIATCAQERHFTVRRGVGAGSDIPINRNEYEFIRDVQVYPDYSAATKLLGAQDTDIIICRGPYSF